MNTTKQSYTIDFKLYYYKNLKYKQYQKQNKKDAKRPNLFIIQS